MNLLARSSSRHAMTSTGGRGKHTSRLVLAPDRDSQTSLLPETFLRWFAGRGWAPREHQLALLAKARDDRSALLIAPTGAGKTLAGFLPTLMELSGLSPLQGGREKKLVSTGRALERRRGL